MNNRVSYYITIIILIILFIILIISIKILNNIFKENKLDIEKRFNNMDNKEDNKVIKNIKKWSKFIIPLLSQVLSTTTTTSR